MCWLGAYMDLKEVHPAVNLHKVAAESLQCEAMFNDMRKRMEADPATAKKINGVFLYNITKNGQVAGKWGILLSPCYQFMLFTKLKNITIGTYWFTFYLLISVVDLKQCKLYKGDPESGVKPDTTLTVDDQDMIDIVSIAVVCSNTW